MKAWQRRLLILSVVCGLFAALLWAIQPVRHIDPESVTSVDIRYWDRIQEGVDGEDKERIVDILNDIPVYFPDIRPWKYQLAGGTLDSHILVHFTSGDMLDIHFMSGRGPGIRWNDGGEFAWLIGRQYKDRLKLLMQTYYSVLFP